MRSACVVGPLIVGLWAPSKAVRLGVGGGAVQRPQAQSLALDVAASEERDLEDGLIDHSAFGVGGYYQYFPGYNVSVCSCAKCGSTTLSRFLYKTIFKKDWSYKGQPWIQEVSPRWEDALMSIDAARLRRVKSTFALRRDPKERLMSAWKSKVACNETEWGTDILDRKVLVPDLIRKSGLWGRLKGRTCLGFKEFLKTLKIAYDSRRQPWLNHHFQPQHFLCFRDMPPSEWTKVSEISDPGFASQIAAAFGDTSHPEFPREHASKAPKMSLTEEESALLDDITREEYAALQK